MSISNELAITVYSSGTTRIQDVSAQLANAESVEFETFWPGGLFGAASLFVPRDVLRWWGVNGAKRIALFNGGKMVYEGSIDTIDDQLDADGEGKEITITGPWGSKVMRDGLRRNYVDTRIDDSIWPLVLTPAGGAKFDIGRSSDAGPCILITPKNVAMTNTDFIQVDYFAPVGEAIQSIVLAYDFTEKAGETFTLAAYDVSAGLPGTALNISGGGAWSVTATGASSVTLDGGAAVTRVALRLSSGATQTPTGDGQTVVELIPKVYARTANSGNVANNVDEIAKDLVASFTDIFNQDVSNIDTPASPFAIEPFIVEWWTLAEILSKAAGYGDGATPPNAWSVYLLPSDAAATPSGLPVLALKQYPALTSYDVAVRLSDSNVVAPVMVRKDYSGIVNWVTVQYQTDAGKTAFKTPEDDAGLTDATSVANNGRRIPSRPLNYGNASAAMALNLAKRFLAQWKDPIYIINQPITVQSFIRTAGGGMLPACQIRAGMRLAILDYNPPVIAYITHTQYSADNETCAMTAGAQDDLAAIISQLEFVVTGGDTIGHKDTVRRG